MNRVRPVDGKVLLVDDQPETLENGVLVRRPSTGATLHLDYTVAHCPENGEYGPGDRVVLSHPTVGRSVFLDGVAYRLVEPGDVIGVVE